MTAPAGVRMMAIDPGAVHNGFALFVGANCYETGELSPADLFLQLDLFLSSRSLDELVVESFELYPWKTKEQHFSQLQTVQVIGVIIHLAVEHGYRDHWSEPSPGDRIFFQKASIKKPTFAICKGRGVEVQGRNQHMRDAFAHGFYRLQHRS